MDEPRKRRPLRRSDWTLLALAAVIAGGLAMFWFQHRQPAPSAEGPAIGPTSASPAASPPGPAPAVDEGRVRSLLDSVSTSPLFRRWVAMGDLVRRWVVVTDNLAEGVTPRKQLDFLGPGRPFSVVGRGNKLVMAPDSYRRYDELADVVASIDAQALAKVYRELHPVLEAAYRALGYPGASFDHVTAKALRRIEAAPAEEGEVVVRGERGFFVFADPRLEKLGAAEKHLLRMGPRNTRMLQAKAREIREALGLAAEVAGHQR